MSGTQQNVETLKEAYRQWHETKAGSADHWLSLMAEEVKFRSLGEGRPGMEFSEDRASKDEVRGYIESLISAWEMDYYATNQYIAQDDWVAVLGSCGWTNKATGKAVDTPKADFFRFKDGKIVAFYEFYNTAMLFEAAR